MPNRDTAAAWEYHNRTKHSPRSVRESRHLLDWHNQPLLFKTYEGIDPIPLEAGKGRASMPALAAMCRRNEPVKPAPDRSDLATLLYFSAGITRRRRFPGGEVLYRAASNTGALYEVELYLVCGDLDGLGAGVYHFDPGGQTLRCLRQGDFRGVLARATAQEPAVSEAPAVIVSTGTYWRNAWKYQARTYRHFGWDNGTLHANLLAIANALGMPWRLVCGFVDDEVNRLLAIDSNREVSLALVPLGSGAPAPPPGELPELDFGARLPSGREMDYPIMREMHAASSLSDIGEVAEWRLAAVSRSPSHEPSGDAIKLEPLRSIPQDTIEEVILRRGSSRRFERRPITLAELSAMLGHTIGGLDADFVEPGATLNDVYVIVHAVEGLRPGAYFYDPAGHRLEPLKYGEFRTEAAFLALEQDLAGDAAAAIFFLADLDRWLERFGNRAYRVMQLEAGVAGGRAYLGAYALGLGASGLTFYDDEATRFFSPHAAGKSAIFLVAVGHPASRNRPAEPLTTLRKLNANR